MSQDIFQKKIDQTYEKCKRAVGIVDDIQVFGSDQTHDLHLHEAMERTRKAGIKLNYDKCIVKSRSCSFFGNIYTPEGVKPDPSKIDAIKRMEAPSTNQQLQSFLDIVNYLSSYIYHMSDLTSNLRNLLKKNSLFQWTETHKAEFQMLKKAISKDVNLQYFAPKKPVVLQVDAPQVGLGAASSFSVFGIPEEIISDNGSQFTAKEYQDFAARYGFRITTSSPHYPRGHAFIKCQVQTKHIITKCAQDGSDPHLALLQFTATPLDCRTPSPGKDLQNRQLRTTLPAIIRPPPNSEAV